MVSLLGLFKKRGIAIEIPRKKENKEKEKRGGFFNLKGLDILSKVGLKTVRELVGIDIGTTSIKLCLLKNTKDGLVFHNFARKSYKEPILNDGIIIDPLFLADELKNLLMENHIKCRDAASALSSYTTIIKKVQVPFLEEEELENIVRTEVENVIPFPLNDIYYSYYVAGINEEKSDLMDVQIVAVKREIVDGFVYAFEKAGLKLQILDVDIFGAANLIEEIYNPKEYSVVAVDVGASITNIAIIKGEHLEFTREVLLGGTYLTGQIEKSTGLDHQEAEEKKLAGDSEVSYLFEDFIFNISSEITKTINFYMATKPNATIGKIYLCGGSSLLPGLKERIGLDTNLEVDYIDPFQSLSKTEIERLAIPEEERVFATTALYLSSRVRDIKQ